MRLSGESTVPDIKNGPSGKGTYEAPPLPAAVNALFIRVHVQKSFIGMRRQLSAPLGSLGFSMEQHPCKRYSPPNHSREQPSKSTRKHRKSRRRREHNRDESEATDDAGFLMAFDIASCAPSEQGKTVIILFSKRPSVFISPTFK